MSPDPLLDAAVLVDHLRGRRRLDVGRQLPAISVVTRWELVAGADPAPLLRRLLGSMVEFCVDARVAELAGSTVRETGPKVPDARIAATATVHELPVMTRNRRHVARVDGLAVLAPS